MHTGREHGVQVRGALYIGSFRPAKQVDVSGVVERVWGGGPRGNRQRALIEGVAALGSVAGGEI